MQGRQQTHKRQHGAVSLFVVMFTAMLFVAVTVGFTVLMLSDQQQSTDNDLAQSALDSARAGEEDAKRVLAEYTRCVEGNITGIDCNTIKDAVERGECGTIQRVTGGDVSNERQIQTDTSAGGDETLDQAYTCVKVKPDTVDYIGTTRTDGDIRLVPLKTVSGTANRVTVQWLSPSDLKASVDDSDLDHDPKNGLAGQPSTIDLPNVEDWDSADKGAILRVGSIQYQPGGVNVTDMDKNARAAFLHPEVGGGPSEVNLETIDMHKPIGTDPGDLEVQDIVAKTPNTPKPSHCEKDEDAAYLCKTTFILPAGDASTLRYLTIASMYRNTSFRVQVFQDSTLLRFQNVQPQIDVTGRANDVFRRVVSRVESADASEAPYPRAALGTVGDICKNYLVTDDPDDYYSYAAGSCRTNGAIVDPSASVPSTP